MQMPWRDQITFIREVIHGCGQKKDMRTVVGHVRVISGDDEQRYENCSRQSTCTGQETNKQKRIKAYVNTLKHREGCRKYARGYLYICQPKKNGSSISLDRTFDVHGHTFFFLSRYSQEVTLYQREAKKKKENVRKSRALTDQLLHSAHKNISTPDTKSGLKMLTTICRHNVRWQSTNTSFPSSEWRGGLAAVPEKTEYEGVAMYRTVSKTRKKKTTDEEKQ